MSTAYTFPAPMSVDEACRAVYGDESGFVEAVLAANPGAAERPAIKPAGFVLQMPDLDLAGDDAPPVVALWS